MPRDRGGRVGGWEVELERRATVSAAELPGGRRPFAGGAEAVLRR
ncbi:hypothetical protein [Streptomyces sp. KAU_LT]|nr:hypothetical protein [Streptomyces sp. KAU_LT]MDI9834403.1 hypothetical protein [Streptomyces sp. KAU_LT]